MRLIEILKAVFTNIATNKFRVFLTALGIIVGVLDNYLTLNNLTLGRGEFFQSEDSENRTQVAVLGMDLAEILFPGEGVAVVGQTVQLAGRKFDIIGVMNQAGDAKQGVNMDESVLIPYGTAIKYVTGTDAKPRITAVATDVNVVQDAIMEINDILWMQHEGDASAFIVKDAGSKLVAAQDSAKTMSVLLISVAAILLLVGGLMMPLMYLLDVTVIPSVYGNVLALIFSIATGTFFGYYPAVKAASLHPIDALRQE